ncbi:MAG: VCBS repeat-containing protein [Bacteroidales bacterium]|jgi:hypothetical protein
MKSKLMTAGLAAWFAFAITPAGAQISFIKHTLATIGKPLDVTVGDLNSDGHPDLATVSTTDGEVAWWESNGQGGYTKKQIRTGFDGGRTIRSGDIDGDSDIDLIAASINLKRIEWYENDGSQKFTIHVLDGNFRGAHTVQLYDLDRDGDMDILCSGWDNSAALSEMAWWENKGNQVFTKHVVSSSMDQAPFIDVADIDLDGDLDLIGSDEISGEIYWWENNGFQSFTEHLIDGQFTLAHTVLARDIDKDGDPDILAAAVSSGMMAWYENKGAGTFEKHAMENLGGAIWLDMADFDSDGDNDMVATGMSATQLVLYANNGRQGFTKSLITGGLTSGFALNITDLDQDGDQDVVAIGTNSNFLGWWENTSDRIALIQSPSWVAPGPVAGNFLVVNNDLGNIIATSGSEPVQGIVNPGYCQGITLVGNLLYACSGSALNVYRPETGISIASYRTDAQFLVGIAPAPSGMIYLSAPLDGKILGFNPITGLFQMVAEGLNYPGALMVDPVSGEILLLDGEEEITVKSINPANGSISIKQQTSIKAGGDIETDGVGNFYISSPSMNSIFVNTSGWSAPIMLYRTGLGGPWGMWFDKLTHDLVVVMNGGNRIERIPATASGTWDIPAARSSLMSVYPNPFTDRIRVCIPGGCRPGSVLKLVSPEGKVIQGQTRFCSELRSTDFVLDRKGQGILQPGIYYMIYTDESRTLTAPLIHIR